MPPTTMESPVLLNELAAAARVDRTPCGDGSIVWRSWGSGARVAVLLHGGFGSWAHWVRNIPALSRHFTLWVPDLPGMGESALPHDPWTLHGIATLLEQGLTQLIGGQRVDLVGFSFGGMLAGHWAALFPQRVRQMVALAPAGTGLGEAPKAAMVQWRGVPDAAQRLEIHRRNLCTWMLFDPARADALAAQVAFMSVEADRLRNREVAATNTLLVAMKNVACRADAILGDQDMLYRRWLPKVEKALLASGFASVTILRDAGHWAQYEQPEAFNAKVLGLLDTA